MLQFYAALFMVATSTSIKVHCGAREDWTFEIHSSHALLSSSLKCLLPRHISIFFCLLKLNQLHKIADQEYI